MTPDRFVALVSEVSTCERDTLQGLTVPQLTMLRGLLMAAIGKIDGVTLEATAPEGGTRTDLLENSPAETVRRRT